MKTSKAILVAVAGAITIGASAQAIQPTTTLNPSGTNNYPNNTPRVRPLDSTGVLPPSPQNPHLHRQPTDSALIKVHRADSNRSVPPRKP